MDKAASGDQQASSPTMYILICLFGMSSWVAVNGIIIENPIITLYLPEGWALLSYSSIIIQIGNIGPLSIALYNAICKKRLPEEVLVYVVIGLGALTSLLLIFFWRETIFVAGANRSVAYFILQFIMSIAACSSAVVYFPYMSKFPPQYMTALFIGFGFSGLIPSLLALGQGVAHVTCVNKTTSVFRSLNASSVNSTWRMTSYTNSGNITIAHARIANNETSSVLIAEYDPPRYSAEVFMGLIFILMLVSAVSLFMLNRINQSRKSKSKIVGIGEEMKPFTQQDNEETSENGPFENNTDKNTTSNPPLTSKDNADTEGLASNSVLVKTNCNIVFLLVVNAWVNGIENGILFALQSFAAGPYGNETFHISAVGGSIVDPVACFINYFVRVGSSKILVILTIIATGLMAYIAYLAVLSPNPPLKGTIAGIIIMVMLFLYFRAHV